jgi:hypothetical protein
VHPVSATGLCGCLPTGSPESATVVASCSVTAAASGWFDGPKRPEPGTVVPVLPAGQPNPMIANGVAIGANVLTYKTSGFGPSALNTAAPAGSEARYIETAVFPAERCRQASPSPRRRASTHGGSVRTCRRPGCRTRTCTRCGCSCRTPPARRPPTSPAGTAPTGSTSPTST